MDGFSFGVPFAIAAMPDQDAVSNDYFDSLPKDVQAGINEHASEIHSEEDLHRIAETLMKKS